MRINESRIRRIIREEAYRVLREGEFDDFGGGEDMGDPFEGEGGEDEGMTAEDIIEQYKDEGPRSWMRVSNDFNEMAEGGMSDIAAKYYPGLDEDDFRMIVHTLDRHFGMGI